MDHDCTLHDGFGHQLIYFHRSPGQEPRFDLLTLYVSLMVILTLKICALQKSSCNLDKKNGPCRFKEPCKPTVLPWNESFVVVSLEGLFEGCHEDQINRMSIRVVAEEGFVRVSYLQVDKSLFAKNKVSFSREVCANSVVSFRIDFKEIHVTTHTSQGRSLFTHSMNCSASFTRGNSFYQEL